MGIKIEICLLYTFNKHTKKLELTLEQHRDWGADPPLGRKYTYNF